MVPEPVQEQVMQAKCPAPDYNRVPVPPGVTNDHQGSETLVMLLHEISSYQKCSGSHHFQFYLSFSFVEQLSYYHTLNMTNVKMSRQNQKVTKDSPAVPLSLKTTGVWWKRRR